MITFPTFIKIWRMKTWSSIDFFALSSLNQTFLRAANHSTTHPLPAVSAALMQFLVNECDFNVEHADGSFLDHLYFCFEYSVQHYPRHSPLVMLLHSILGTGTNTFAMTADKIPQLRPLMTPWEWTQVEAFP